MKHIKKTITLLGVVLVLFGCSKDDDAPVQNVAPQIANQEFSISEDAIEGTVIGTLVATDSDALTYSITTNDNDLFALTNAGVLSLATGKALNYNIAQTHSITVAVSDGTNTTEATITIKVTDFIDVYVAGFQIDGAINRAMLWKNGIGTTLSSNGNYARAKDVYVLGEDVYVVGHKKEGTTNVDIAMLWQNGMATNLTEGSNNARANSVYVSGEDVYVVGYKKSRATIWKNGNPTSLPRSSAQVNSAAAFSVYVSGNMVYVAGEEVIGGKSQAVLWENDNITVLTDGTSQEAYATSVFVSGNDVYASGAEYDGTKFIPRLWGNGGLIDLTNGISNSAYANSVYALGENIYVAGYDTGTGSSITATLWNNGEATGLTTSGTNSIANDVYVLGEDIYVAGVTGADVTVWKNGVVAEELIDGGKGQATAIFVK
ncbi:cadherin repeat domain-containing protein [Aquimarina algiphila]|uniref:cadherin repeat domain-containing protein n=1 Tax=Aquimarina algiphila TaxID=2047982 RepID=UPI00232E18B6|nr:cadherin repeat domain-containing protein [Aquimarina algiphila]